jgi:hypothetical protein
MNRTSFFFSDSRKMSDHVIELPTPANAATLRRAGDFAAFIYHAG